MRASNLGITMVPARAGWWGISRNNGRSVYTRRMSFIIALYVREGMVMGGPIDVLVIKPDEAFWVQRKELHGQH
jgi:hypothetical protein